MWHAFVIPALRRLKQALQGSLDQQASLLGSLAQAPDLVDFVYKPKQRKQNRQRRQTTPEKWPQRLWPLHTQAYIHGHACVHTHTHTLEHTKEFTKQKVEQCGPLG